MLDKMLFGKTVTPLAEKCLDAYSLRHKAIANNIANVEVPGYNRREVQFEDELKRCLKKDLSGLCTTHEKHIPISKCKIERIQPRMVVDESNPKLNAVNNVDIDMEMADLAKNQIDFDLMSTALRLEYQRLRMAIRGQ